MKTIRILSLMLALLMIGSTLLLFSSCTKEGKMNISRKRVSVDLSKYAMIYADKDEHGAVSVTYKSRMADFAAALNSTIGLTLRATAESAAKTSASDPEILIGKTSREESTKALESIKGHGYTIQVTDNKIVIVGTTNLLTMLAVRYFEENYLTSVTGSGLTIPKNATLQKAEMLTLMDGEECYVDFVRSKDLDTDAGNEYGEVNIGTGRDFAYDLLQNTLTTLIKLSSIDKRQVSAKQKTDAASAEGGEFIIGPAERDVAKACRSELAGDEYGIFVRDGSVVVTSWSDAALQVCAQNLQGYLQESRYTDEDGKHSIILPADLKITGRVDKNWVTDFPKPEGDGIELYRTADGENDSLIYVYMGDGVNAAAYTDYMTTLKGEGYAVVSENEAEDSRFAFLYNRTEKTTLYVAYNAFKHKDVYGGNFAFDEPTLRVVSAPSDSVTVPSDKLFSKQSYKKVTDSAITAVALPSGQIGTGYVMLLEDGSFLVFDGGGGEGAEMIWSIMTELHEKITEKATSSSNPVRIAAWTITHSHSDHYHGFRAFAKTYGKSGLVRMEYLLGNFPSANYMYNTGESDTYMTDKMDEFLGYFSTPFKYLKVHTGQKYYFANAEVEILFTPEDMVPHRIVTGNDASTIMRISLQPTENGQSAGKAVSFINTGDAYKYSGRWTCAMFGEYLDSDMVAVAHHGGPGTEKAFYNLISPDVVWFPNKHSSYTGYYKQGSEWYMKVDQYVIEELESVECVIYAEGAHTTVFVTKDGPDLENFYAGGEGHTFTAEENTVAVTKK